MPPTSDTPRTPQPALITGASSGIGEATAVRLAQDGHPVACLGRREDRLTALVETIKSRGGAAIALPCDVTDAAAVAAAVNTAIQDFGGIGIVINNAGIMPLGSLLDDRLADWTRCIDTNLTGILNVTAAVLPGLIAAGSGHIINISSVAGRKLFPGATVYCSVKAAVHLLSEGLRLELAQHAAEHGGTYRVTVIAPGVVTTELIDSIGDVSQKDHMQRWIDSMSHPLTSEDIADAIAYAINAPDHIAFNELLIRPTEQVG